MKPTPFTYMLKTLHRIVFLTVACIYPSGLAIASSHSSPETPLQFAQVANSTCIITMTGRRILTEAYNTLGIPIIFIEQPAERALRQSNKGVNDGELLRISGLSKTYENLIRIPVTLFTTEVRVFTRKQILNFEDWDSLRPYHIGIHRGHKYAELNTEEMTRTIVTHRENIFKMLQAGRFDLTIADRHAGQEHINKLHLNRVKMLSPPLERNPLFHYLHKKHQTLIPRITATLRTMKASGRIEAILSDVEGIFISTHAKTN